ncbi:MAG TPA: sigma-70 family RNA polymerase sigma factor [Actinobacteria bacterium]|nr:sigma-70 family RNA polymerase sigma factor [Actinomycetota bacterium]
MIDKAAMRQGTMEVSDEQLVFRVNQGDSSAYESLFERYQGAIYNFSYSIVGNREDAKDVAQEAFIKVFEALPRLSQLNFSAYLYRTARNIAIDEIKAKKRFGRPDILEIKEETNIHADPQRALLLGEQQAQVKAVAQRLPEDQRTALTLREIQELPYEQISSIMDMPKNSVGVLLMRARMKFKQEFRMSQLDIEKLSLECKKMLPLLSALIDNELDDAKKVEVKEHLEDCPLCRLALEEFTQASRSYRAIVPLIPPASIKAGVWSKTGHFIKGQSRAVGQSPNSGSETTGVIDKDSLSSQAPKLDAPESMLTTAPTGGLLTRAREYFSSHKLVAGSVAIAILGGLLFGWSFLSARPTGPSIDLKEKTPRGRTINFKSKSLLSDDTNPTRAEEKLVPFGAETSAPKDSGQVPADQPQAEIPEIEGSTDNETETASPVTPTTETPPGSKVPVVPGTSTPGND